MNSSRSYLIACVVAVLVSACGGTDDATDPGAVTDQESSANVLEVTMQEYAFAVDGEVTAGPAVVNFTNNGEQIHHGIVGKLADGKTLDDVQAYLEKGEQGPPPPWFDDSPIDETLISPGNSSGVVLDLEEGTYVLLCFMPDPKGQPHVAHGMAQTFEVGAAGDSSAIEPDDSVSMTRESIEAPEVPADSAFVEVTNDDDIAGEVYVVQAPNGLDPDAIDKWFRGGQKGPAPVDFFGGTHTFEPGESVTLHLELEPGDYQIVASYEVKGEISDEPTDFTVSG